MRIFANDTKYTAPTLISSSVKIKLEFRGSLKEFRPGGSVSLKVQLAPSILSADFGFIDRDAKRLEKAGADLVHADVMDGHFVDNLTIGPDMVAAIRRATKLPIDTHLMITDPEKYVDAFIKAGSDYVSFHAEAAKSVSKLIKRIRSQGVKAGIAINPDTPVAKIRRYLSDVDFVLVMTVYPGRSGQSMIGSAVAKIGELKAIAAKQDHKYFVEVDGGIKVDNVQKVLDQGVDMIVSGSGVFNSDGPARSISKFKKVFKLHS